MTADAAPQLILGAGHRDALCAAAEAAYPDEFCALLIGIDGGAEVSHVTRVVLAANVHPRPKTNFDIDPKVLIDVLRSLREVRQAGHGSERLLGHAHSHPDGPAWPSALDLGQANEAGVFWVVMAVRLGIVEAVNAFRVIEENGTKTAFQPAQISG